MGPIQSMILGEPDKDKSIAAPPEAQPVVKPSVDHVPNEQETVEHSSNVASLQGHEQGGVEQVAPKPEMEHPTKQYNSLGDVTDAMYKSRMPTEEELAKERKREKSRQIISAIADGVSAISNLYFTGKGAKNVEQTSMSAANTKRYQEILDRRRKTQEKWDDARLEAYYRDRGFNYQKDRDDANWKRSGKWHNEQVKRDDERYKDSIERTKALDEYNKAERDRNYELHREAQKDASARGWAAVNSQDKRIKAQEEKQRAYIKYQFEKMNGAPEPKRINSTRSIYVGKHTWEQNAGQIAGEIIKDIEASDPALAKQLTRQINGFAGKKGADAKQTAAIVDKYIMSSPRAQQLAIELENDYKKRYELATGGSLSQDGTDDLGFVPSSSGKESVDVDSLFD